MKRDIQKLFREFVYEYEFVKRARKDTLRGYISTFNLFLKLCPSITLETLSSGTIVSFFKILHERKKLFAKGTVKIGVKKSTLATYWSKLNTFFKWLQSKQYITENPFATLQYPTPSFDDKQFLRKEEIEKIITAIHTHHDNNLFILKRNLVLFYILLFCGLRREEVMLLQVRDIDFEKKILTVRSETSKSGRSRQLPLHSTCIMHLKDYLNARKDYTTPNLLVSSKRDEPLTYAGLKHLIERIKTASGVTFHVHQFRHTFAVNFLKNSRDIAKLKQLMGHKSIAMTLSYLRCLPTDELRADIETMSIDNLM